MPDVAAHCQLLRRGSSRAARFQLRARGCRFAAAGQTTSGKRRRGGEEERRRGGEEERRRGGEEERRRGGEEERRRGGEEERRRGGEEERRRGGTWRMVIIYLLSASYRGSNKRDFINQMDIQKYVQNKAYNLKSTILFLNLKPIVLVLKYPSNDFPKLR